MSWIGQVDGSSSSTEETVDVAKTFGSTAPSENDSGPRYNFADQSALEMDWEAASSIQQTSLEINAPKGGYGDVEDRGIDVQLTCPVDDLNELRKKFHLMVQQSNVDLPVEYTDEVEALVDERLLDIAEFYFACVDLSINELSAPLQHAKAQYLHDAWTLNSKPKLNTHLERQDGIADRLGFEPVPDQSIFWYHEQKLKGTGEREKISKAAEHGVYSLLRNDVPLPEEVFEICG